MTPDQSAPGAQGDSIVTEPDYADIAGNEASARALAESMGFVYWPGGDGPPADWDGGPYLCRDGETYWMCGYDWGHGTHCWNLTASWDRIGYKRIKEIAL